ncbi:MAG: ABC transporter substrate-binding protein [Bacteroidota bacterium]
MTKKIFIDQMGRKLEVSEKPLRILSLVPSQTELLAYLGLENNVVGITKFCIHPNEWFHNKKRVGGTKNLKIQEIINLKPDLIIGNKEENTESDILALAEYFPVWMSDINSVEEAILMIREVGKLTNTTSKAEELITKVEEGFQRISSHGKNRKVLYCIWDEPTMVVGKETYIHSVLTKLGFENVVHENRYPALTDLNELNPEIVLLSSEPFPFGDNHIKKYQELFPNAEVQLVDGEMFSWYGSRMLKALTYFENLSFK